MEIQPLQPRQLPTLLEFLQRQFPDQPLKSDERYFRWRFEHNPLGSTLDSYLLVWEHDRIVGQMATLPDRIWDGHTWHDARWLVDLIIDTEHRGSLASLRLFQALMQKHSLLLATGAGGHMLKLYQALGWQTMPLAETYFLPLRPSRLLHIAAASGRQARPPVWMRPVLGASNLTLPLVHRARNSWQRSSSFPVQFAESVKQSADQLCQLIDRLQPALACTNYRSGEILRWKLDQRPVGDHDLLLARSANHDQLAGFLAVKWMHRQDIAAWGDVVDYLVDPDEPDLFPKLLDKLQRAAVARNVDFVRFRLSDAQHQHRLGRRWWVRRTSPVSDAVFLRAQDAELAQRLSSRPWHLTALASDRADYGGDEWDEFQ